MMFTLAEMEPVPAEDMERLIKDNSGCINPFHYDLFNMGMNFSEDVMYMYAGHFGDTHRGGYFINIKTGERQRLVINKKEI